MIRWLGRITAGLALLALPASAQDREPTPPAKVPYGVGELLEYDISFGKIHVGNGSMEVLPMDTVRGHDVWHTLFRINGGLRFVYTVHDRYEDWSDVQTLASLRYHADIDEGGYSPKRRFEIYPERKEYVQTNKDTTAHPSVAHPLNEASFLYFLRTIPLHVGMDTSFNDFFQAERNPVRFKVVRKDTIEVGAGKFSALVVQPVFASKLFSEGGHAEVWLSDDENRIMLQMKSKLSFGSLNLYLKSYHPSPTTNVPLNRVP
ncbi:MAG TPA: DUF3108 domain-containing protein [Gemmatimonadaceae bacterium]